MHKDNSSTTIAIIGGGFSGSMVATHLLQTATYPLNIKLIERNSLLGRGVAYDTYSPYHLLNALAGQISAFPDHPNHFLHWIQKQNYTIDNFVASVVTVNTFVPRKIYGDYIQAILDESEINASNYVYLERITDEALDIKPRDRDATVYLSSGRVIRADRIVLAVGNFPPADPWVQERSFYKSSRYKGNAYSAEALTGLDPDDPVLLIGTGLTMVDLILTLFVQGHRGKIYAVSRHGLLPLPHKITPPIPPFISVEAAPKTIRALIHLVRQQVQFATASGQDWRTVINSLRPITQNLWQTLSVKEQQRFLRHVRPYWDIHRHRIAPEIAQIVNKLLSSGQLVVYAGHILGYREDSCGVDVTIRKRHTTEDIVLRASRVVNCTGPASNYEKLKHPLINNLFSQGLICSDPLQIGLACAPNGALLDATGMPSELLYTLGSTRKGELWEITAVPEIRQQAIALAQELLLQVTTEANRTIRTNFKQSTAYEVSHEAVA